MAVPRRFPRDSSRGIATSAAAGYNCVVSSTDTESSPFAGQLRRWRASRRISQLELALRAGTTQRHLSFMESGRSRPGRQIVVRLAESLDLTLRERNELLLAAGFAPVFPESDLSADALRPVREALRRILDGHLPYPAVVVDRYGVLVAANSAFDLLTEGASAELLRPPINTLRLALHPDGMGNRVLNLAEWGQHIVHNLRDRLQRSPDQRAESLLAELVGYLPAAAPGPDHLGFAVPLRLRAGDRELRLLTTLTSFATAVDVTLAELRLEAFLPADEDTAAHLRARAGSGGLG